ncbi:MAG: hypothetical protein Kow0098_27470 [Ignavibacteriaceae bacterium]
MSIYCFNMKFFLYILYSPAALRTYVGQTNNISNRLSLHNSGKVRSTKAFSPWILIFSEAFSSRADAMKKEKWFKSPVGRKKLSEILKQFLASETNGLSVRPVSSGRTGSRSFGTD